MREDSRRSRLFRLVLLAAALGLVVGGLSSCATPAPPAPATAEVMRETVVVKETVIVPATPETPELKEPIRIGISEPFTGPVAWIGEDYLRGTRLAAEEINAEGGIQGHPVEIFACDDEALPEKSISCVRFLIDQQDVQILLDMGSSGTALACMPVIEEYADAVLLISACSSALISDRAGEGGNIWTFRANPNDRMMALAFSGYVAAQTDSVSFYSQNSEYGRGAVEQMKPLLEAAGVDVLSEDYFEAGQPDHRPVLTRIKSLNPGAVYSVMEAMDAATMMRQFHELGLTAKVFARGSVVSLEFLDAIADDPSLGEGIVECTFADPGASPDFMEAYTARWNESPPMHAAAAYDALRYIIPQAVEFAIQETGGVTATAIRDGFEKVSVETPVFGLVEFDEYHQAHTFIFLKTIEDGEIKILDTLIPE